jgi:hypothetical protein
VHVLEVPIVAQGGAQVFMRIQALAAQAQRGGGRLHQHIRTLSGNEMRAWV